MMLEFAEREPIRAVTAGRAMRLEERERHRWTPAFESLEGTRSDVGRSRCSGAGRIGRGRSRYGGFSPGGNGPSGAWVKVTAPKMFDLSVSAW